MMSFWQSAIAVVSEGLLLVDVSEKWPLVGFVWLILRSSCCQPWIFPASSGCPGR